VARLCHGTSAALFPSPYITASADCCNAAAFSDVMRWYSAAEHVPWTIIRLRSAIVSHDAIINSVIISGRARLRRRVSFFMTGTIHRCEDEDRGGDEPDAVKPTLLKPASSYR
jgi:hypothetical protein